MFWKDLGRRMNVENDNLLREETFVTSNQHALWVTRFPLPSGIPSAQVVFIHGHGSYCTRTFGLISERLHSIGVASAGYDQHSYGRSVGLQGDCDNDSFLGPLRASAYSMEIILQDAIDVIQHVFIPGVPLILYGESIGGAISMHLAASESLSIKVDGLILLGPFCGFDEKLSPPAIVQMIGSIIASVAPFAPITPLGRDLVSVSYKDPTKRVWVKNDPLRYHGQMRLGTALCIREIAKKAGHEDLMSRINSPVCVIYGTDDVVTPPSASTMVFEKTMGKKKFLVPYEKAFHTLFAENQDTIELLLQDICGFIVSLGYGVTKKEGEVGGKTDFPDTNGAFVLEKRPEGKIPFVLHEK